MVSEWPVEALVVSPNEQTEDDSDISDDKLLDDAIRKPESLAADIDTFQFSKRPISSSTSEVVDEPVRNDSLCSICQSIFTCQHVRDGYGHFIPQLHHSEYGTLQSSAIKGCYICSLLVLRTELLDNGPGTNAEKGTRLMLGVPSLKYRLIHTKNRLGLDFHLTDGFGGLIYPPFFQLKMSNVPGQLPQKMWGILSIDRSKISNELSMSIIRQAFQPVSDLKEMWHSFHTGCTNAKVIIRHVYGDEILIGSCLQD